MHLRYGVTIIAFGLCAVSARAEATPTAAQAVLGQLPAKYRPFDQAKRAKVRRWMKVDPARAPRSIGAFDALDHLYQTDRQAFGQAVQKVSAFAAVALESGGMPKQQARAVVGAYAQLANEGKYEELLYHGLVHAPNQMKALMQQLHREPLKQMLPDGPRKYLLPKKVVLSRAASLISQLPGAKSAVELQLTGPVVRATAKNPHTSTEQVQKNVFVAEVLQRLAENQHQKRRPFSVAYKGKSYRHLGEFLEALQADGHRVSVRYDFHSADFFRMKMVLPAEGQTPEQALDAGRYKNVALALHVPSPYTDADGEHIPQPAPHGEIYISIEGPAFSGNAIAYQGVPYTGIFPADRNQGADWIGTRSQNALSGGQAAEAITRFGFHTAMVNQEAKRAGKRMADYGGAPGVCIDSVATNERAMGLKVTGHPLMGAEGASYIDAAYQQLVTELAGKQQQLQAKATQPFSGSRGQRARQRSARYRARRELVGLNKDLQRYTALREALAILGQDSLQDNLFAATDARYPSWAERVIRTMANERAMGSEQEIWDRPEAQQFKAAGE